MPASLTSANNEPRGSNISIDGDWFKTPILDPLYELQYVEWGQNYQVIFIYLFFNQVIFKLTKV